MIDMTDYEYEYPSPNETNGFLPMSHMGRLTDLKEEPYPEQDYMSEWVKPESVPRNILGKTMKEGEMERVAREQAEADEDEEEEGDDDDDDDEDEEGEDDEEEADEEEEEEEIDPYALPAEINTSARYNDRYFKRNENLHTKFNEVELDGFMKILDIKPYRQW
jgi:TATA-binding protein-associated factor Taf7